MIKLNQDMEGKTWNEKYGKVVGIDLGTTNSVVATIEGGKPKVIINQEGLRTTPSIVAFTESEGLKVGQIAKRQAILNTDNTFFSVKRFIGATEVTEEQLNILPYDISYDEKAGVKIYSPARKKTFTPEQISGWVLRKLIEDANSYLGQEITQAVITVPAYFNDSQRQATIDAGKIAGIEVLRIINEPTAASLAYGLDTKINNTILVFDLGGGTFDVSILEVGQGFFEVLATAGDTYLGGDDFDRVLINWLLDGFEKEEGINLREKSLNNNQSLQRLTEAAEKAKIELSSVETTRIHLPFITADKNGPKHIDKKITREEFVRLCQPLIDKCKKPIEVALKDANLTKDGIDDVLLVGGSTRIPAIQDLIRSMIGKELSKSVDPDEVVALGAAIQAGILTGEIKDILLLDVTPLSLGIETFGELLTKIIPRNTTIPVKKSETFSTAYENQTNAEIHILQGEGEMAKDNKSLGRFGLHGIPATEQGVPEIDITFDLNVDGILSVKAKERGTGTEQSIEIQGTSTLEQDEVERMLQAAEAYKAKYAEERSNTKYRKKIEKIWNEANEEIIRYKKKGYRFNGQSIKRRNYGSNSQTGEILPIPLINNLVDELNQTFKTLYSITGKNSEKMNGSSNNSGGWWFN